MSKQELLEINPYLFNLVTMFSSSAWCQLGKMQNPVSGKIENDLKSAQVTIDILVMLRDKTKGNLTKKEEEMLSSIISNLQINYADEAAKSKKPDLKIENSSTTNKANA
jgi:hypothetical protein